MSHFTHHQSSDGFTLVEVLIAMGILLYGILGIIGMQLALIKANMNSRHLTSAVILAEAKLEDLKQTGFGNNTDGSESNIDETGQGTGIFTRSWTITPGYLGSANLERAVVTVKWKDAVRSHNVSLETILSSKFD